MKTEHIKIEKLLIPIAIIGAVLIIISILGVCFFVGNNIKKNKMVENPSYIKIYNLCIGFNAGKYLTNESYCVIVGNDSISTNLHEYNMIWYVDWNEYCLNENEDIKIILLQYYKDYILAGNDSEESRSEMIRHISVDYKIK